MNTTRPSALPAINEDEAYEIGIEAYTYAYPLVLMELTRRVMTNVAQPDGIRAPMNRFAHASSFPDASFKDVVRPNADTLYSILWYDVSREPLVVTLPDTAGRYYVVPVMDLWTDVFASLGSRTTGCATGAFALVAPGWQGTLPEGVRRVTSPTSLGWIVGRIQTNMAADFDNVRRMQRDLRALPLSAWGRPAAEPADGPVDASVDMKTPPVEQVANLDPAAFFALFAELMKANPPHAADVAMLLRLERIGIVAGASFSLAGAPPAVASALRRAAPDGLRRMLERGRRMRLMRDGWSSSAGMVGIYGSDYLTRAFVAYRGLGALPPDEAMYPSAVADADGAALDGRSTYVLHFDKDRIPPAKAFWSLTMYGEDQFFVDNPIDRYAIGDRDALRFNADGSLDLYVQHASPGQDKASNWLPASAGPFSMTLRLYLPKPEAVDGSWTPPPVRRIA